MTERRFLAGCLAFAVIPWLLGGDRFHFDQPELLPEPALSGCIPLTRTLAMPGKAVWVIGSSSEPLEPDQGALNYGPSISFRRLVDPNRPPGQE